MHRVLLNTLYILKESGYLHFDNGTFRFEFEQETIVRIPAHHISSIVLRADVLLSPHVLKHCARAGIQVTWLEWSGRFAGSFKSPTQGNVLLRIAQFEHHRDPERSLVLAKEFVRGKIRNARHTLARKVRDIPDARSQALGTIKSELDALLKSFLDCTDHDTLRGYEGIAAKTYFKAFRVIFSRKYSDFVFENRTKRPPRDPINALLSFAYTVATHDCRSALEGVGLDPQIGFLHDIRPGRASLALDLVEEFRTSFVDRLIFALVNRGQVSQTSFDVRPGGSVLLSENGRKTFLQAYQKKKERLITHPLFKEKVPFGLVPHIQARLLARCLRGDLNSYPAFDYR